MKYSQKYCLVSFLEPQTRDNEFSMAEWPLHITLTDVFAVDRDATNLDKKVAQLIGRMPPVTTIAQQQTILGETLVVLVEKTDRLIELHNHLVDLLETCGATFNMPEFTRGGFLPHCTVQKTSQIRQGEEIVISTIALVDMFPDGNWQRRKILNIFA